MTKLSNVLSGSNPLSQMKSMSNSGTTLRLGDLPAVADISFSPSQRLDNQMKTSSQVMNYAASKEMAAQGRTDMRGNVLGYADTLG